MFQGEAGVQFAVLIRHFEILWDEPTVRPGQVEQRQFQSQPRLYGITICEFPPDGHQPMVEA